MHRDPTLRPATPADLPAINAVIEAAVQTWDLPERVKRLALPSYRYDDHDLTHLTAVVAMAPDGGIVGVAAWEPAEPADRPDGRTALLLHGLYVRPGHWRSGVGSALLASARAAAADAGLDGLLVKAQADAVPFFLARGMTALPVADAARHYAHRLWLPAGESAD